MKETFDVVLRLDMDDAFDALDWRLARLTGRPDNAEQLCRIAPNGGHRWLRRPREEARRIATLAYVYCRLYEVPGQVDVFRHAVDWHPEESDLRLTERLASMHLHYESRKAADPHAFPWGWSP